MKTIVKKSFLDIQKEEEWLNQEGENGLMLIGYRNGEYEFEDVSPTKYQYKIDIPNYTGYKRKNYLAFLEESGISVVSDYAGRVYLRKNTADGPLDLYTDSKEIRNQISKRYAHFFSIGISQLILGIFLLYSTLNTVKDRGLPFVFTIIVDLGIIVSGLIFLVMAIRKHRNYSIPKDEKNLWE